MADGTALATDPTTISRAVSARGPHHLTLRSQHTRSRRVTRLLSVKIIEMRSRQQWREETGSKQVYHLCRYDLS